MFCGEKATGFMGVGVLQESRLAAFCPRVRLGGRLLPSSGAQPQWASWLSPLEVQACAAGVPSRTRKYRLLVLTYCHKITSREN